MSHDNKQRYFDLQRVLFDLEAALRDLHLWSEHQPAAECLQSTMPFCVDTLDFHQWLQFVLIPRCYALIDNQQALSIGAQILPMAEESFDLQRGTELLLPLIKQLDEILA